MLIDLLSRDNYCSFNIKLASILGLHPAIYLNELLNINEKAIRKDKLADNYFVIDRKYIESRTTFTESEQLEIDELLLSIGVLKKPENSGDSLMLDVTALASLVSAEPLTIKKLEKLISSTNKQKKRTKSEVIIENLKSNVLVTNDELKNAYYDWIDAVYAKQGWMSAKSVNVAQKTIDMYCNHNLDLALLLLEIASTHGDRDLQWTINRYEKDYKLSYRVPSVETAPTSITLSEEIF